MREWHRPPYRIGTAWPPLACRKLEPSDALPGLFKVERSVRTPRPLLGLVAVQFLA